MPSISGELGPHGAAVEIIVGINAARADLLREHGFPVPDPFRIPVQVDTGTAFTGINAAILKALDLRPVDTVEVRTSSTGENPFRAPMFVVSLVLGDPPGHLTFPLLRVLEGFFLPEEAIQGMIGQDVLARCRYVQDGRDRSFSVEW